VADYGNESSDPLKCGKFLSQLSDYQLRKKYAVPLG
jgi:hypothetical protein